MQISIWDAPLPFGDEAGYIGTALAEISNNKFSTNLYIITYKIILRFISDDPVIAHYIMRTISSSCSMIAMTLFFLSFLPEISLLPFSITISLWASTYIVSPPAQFGNINLFAFSITLLSAIPFLRKITLNRYLLFLI